ncbi:gliding motility-associated C-terminal domain-containing protein [Aridibaculum aurantiacum]|uniref:T9SS type B sorting domain-containing protein n=1 Tax=Aridibaculum aurantiacum TaxID=2810307 RepID=UPI001A96720C|nr:gliding motility-associated C-terminal domain-containing protein [Aridibaculum aurantiacum]
MIRNFLTTLTALFLFSTLQSQVYSLNAGFTNGGTVTTCSGTFLDANRNGNYGNNENYAVTFSPGSSIQAIELQFTDLALGPGDTLWVYDGASMSDPLIDAFSSNSGTTSVRASATNTSGSLTVRFISDASGVSRGWTATIRCKSPCQKINASIVSMMPQPDASGFINICKGQSVLFKGSGSYPDNGMYYHQTDTLHRFAWRVSDNRDTSAVFLDSFRHRFNSEGGFLVELRITDTTGCINTTKSFLKVRTGIRPNFNVQVPPRNCSSDSIRITTRPRMVTGSFSNPPVVADSIFLPDGTNAAYETSLNISQFAPGQTLNNLTDLQGILINMEHSWLGDLEMSIKAPNGAVVRLKYQTGIGSGWDSYLGEPVDEPSSTHPFASIAGKGYDYLFSPTPTYGTMTFERGKYKYSYVDNAGQSVNNHNYLPAGSYASEESLAALIGTPLNGLWTISVIDRYSVDNGFIFYWTLKFNPALYPTAEVYNTSFTGGNWSPGLNVITGSDSTATIVLNSPGTFPYTYTVVDNFGCNHDTTFNLVVLDSPVKPNLGPDTAMCSGQSITLRVGNVQGGNTYTWNTGATGTSLPVTQPGRYWVQVRNLNNCSRTDTIEVLPTTPYSVNLGRDTSFCATSPLVLSPATSVPVASYLWSNSSTNNSLTITGPGRYWVEASDAAGCKVRDTIDISSNPINSFNFPGDTSICEQSSITLALQPHAGTSITWSDGTTGNTNTLYGGTIGITANNIGCIRTSQLNVGIRPLPRISAGRDTSMCMGFTVPLSVSYAGAGAQYLWSTGSRDSTITTGTAGSYWAEATVNGCSYRDTVVVAYKDCSCEVTIPNAFSPNNDGINDFFKPTIQCAPINFKMTIFNRYGQKLYEGFDYVRGWNGQVNGSLLGVGTYYYIITFINQNLKREEKFSGSVTLFR